MKQQGPKITYADCGGDAELRVIGVYADDIQKGTILQRQGRSAFAYELGGGLAPAKGIPPRFGTVTEAKRLASKKIKGLA